MKDWIVRTIKKYCNKETLLYVLFGTMTTVVDFAAYNLCLLWLVPLTGIDIANLIANTLAWVVAVVFSYMVNKWLVFRRRAPSRRALFVEMGQFVGARVVSLLVSEVGMFLLVTLAEMDENMSKVLVSVLVVIINFFFMKLIVFRPPDETADQPEE